MSAGLDSMSTAIAAAVSSVAGKFIIYPLDFFKLRLSVKGPDETATTILKKTIKEHGVFGVYLGLGPRLVRTFAQKFNYFYIYEFLLQMYAQFSGVSLDPPPLESILQMRRAAEPGFA
jgi:hypothetical protein